MKRIYLLLVLVSFISNSTFAQSKKELKAEKTQKEYEAIKTLINSKQFEFTGEWATSSKGKQINLLSNPTYLKINNSNGNGFFPFFGTGYSGVGYSSGNGGIEFNTELEDYDVTFNDKKQEILVKFKATGENDTYNVFMRIFAGGNTSITINSNNRSVMNYSGKTTALEIKESK